MNLLNPIIRLYNNPIYPYRRNNYIEYMPINVIKIKPANDDLII